MIRVLSRFGLSLMLVALLAASMACSRQEEPLPSLSGVTTNQLDENGKKVGPWEIKMEKMVARGSFVNGKMDGIWGIYYSNGERKAEQRFVNGKRDGDFGEWSATGKQINSGNYTDGRMTGLWTGWDEEAAKRWKPILKMEKPRAPACDGYTPICARTRSSSKPHGKKGK